MEIIDILLNSMHSAWNTPMIDQGNFISFLENDPKTFSEVTLRKSPEPHDKISIINFTSVFVSKFFLDETKFIGACLEIGAQNFVNGLLQAKLCSLITATKINSSKYIIAFRFGGGCF